MEDHFKKILEDRMLLLDAFRTIHMIIPEASPLSGEFFLKILNVAKYVEDPRKSQVSLDGFMHVEDHYGLGRLPMFPTFPCPLCSLLSLCSLRSVLFLVKYIFSVFYRVSPVCLL